MQALSQRAKIVPAPDWQQIASFYAGRPVTVSFPSVDLTGNPWNSKQGSARDGGVYLNPLLKQTLAGGPTKPGFLYALQTLIHESLHNRADSSPGLHPWSDEWQAAALGANLIPDALQRFYGVNLNSPDGQRYWHDVQQLQSMGPPTAEYQGLARMLGDTAPWSQSLAPTQPMGDQTSYIVAHLRKQ